MVLSAERIHEASQDDIRMKPLPVSLRWRWIAIQALFLVVLCALSGPGMATGEEPRAAGILGAVCFLGPARAASALLEWYLVRQIRQRTILISHVVGLGFGAMLASGPSSKVESPGINPIAGWSLGVFSYVLITLIALLVSRDSGCVTWRCCRRVA